MDRLWDSRPLDTDVKLLCHSYKTHRVVVALHLFEVDLYHYVIILHHFGVILHHFTRAPPLANMYRPFSDLLESGVVNSNPKAT